MKYHNTFVQSTCNTYHVPIRRMGSKALILVTWTDKSRRDRNGDDNVFLCESNSLIFSKLFLNAYFRVCRHEVVSQLSRVGQNLNFPLPQFSRFNVLRICECGSL